MNIGEDKIKVRVSTKKFNGRSINETFVSITNAQIQDSWKFATGIVEHEDQLMRLIPKGITSEDVIKKIGIHRTFAGKIAECGFLNYLKYNNINYNDPQMFKIKPGKTNVDEYDFNINSNNKVDLKTAIFKFQTRLVVNKDQFESHPKKGINNYIGAHLNFEQEDYKDPIKKYYIKDIDKILESNEIEIQLYGYAERTFMDKLRYQDIKKEDGTYDRKVYYKQDDETYKISNIYSDLGEAECKWWYLKNLKDISELLPKFDMNYLNRTNNM